MLRWNRFIKGFKALYRFYDYVNNRIVCVLHNRYLLRFLLVCYTNILHSDYVYAQRGIAPAVRHLDEATM
jgi:hypothetical protein